MLPEVRAACLEHLLVGGASRETVLAAAVRLLDLGCFRIGSDRSATENETFGITTLGRRHVRVDPPLIRFDYPGKSGVHQRMELADVLTAELLATLRRRRGGDRLLVYRDGRRGAWHMLRPPDVNEFLGEVSGEAFTAKDFRTIRATVLAAGEQRGSHPRPGRARRGPPVGGRRRPHRPGPSGDARGRCAAVAPSARRCRWRWGRRRSCDRPRVTDAPSLALNDRSRGPSVDQPSHPARREISPALPQLARPGRPSHSW